MTLVSTERKYTGKVVNLDLDTVRDVLAQDIYGGGASVPQKPAPRA